jgi:uncharacterized protein with HEPN domain
MSKRSDKLLLQDISEAIKRIRMATAAIDQGRFEAEVILQDAVIRNFEVIGEAAKNLSIELRANHPTVDWAGMNGFRNFLIHVYFGVDLTVLWVIIQNDIPVLEKQVEAILSEE